MGPEGCYRYFVWISLFLSSILPPLCSLNTCPYKPPGISLPATSRRGAARLKPEIMTFHCHTGETNETKYHPINNGLLTAGGEVFSTGFLRTQTHSGSAFNLERIGGNAAISKNIWTFSRNIIYNLQDIVGKEEKVGARALWQYHRNPYCLPPLEQLRLQNMDSSSLWCSS